MCDEIGVFTDKEVEKLNPKGRKALKDEALRHLQTPAMKRLVSKDQIGQIIHPHKELRKALREKLRPKLNELKKTSAK